MNRIRFFIVCGLLLASSAICSAAVETYYFFVFSNPVAGHEDEYNKWYNEQHAPDVVAIPGFVTAQRFVKTDLPLYRMVDLQVPKYLVIYKIVTGDLEAVFKEVARRLETKETVMSPTFDAKTSVSYVYRTFRPESRALEANPMGPNPVRSRLTTKSSSRRWSMAKRTNSTSSTIIITPQSWQLFRVLSARSG
jgi:hypothetical protein